MNRLRTPLWLALALLGTSVLAADADIDLGIPDTGQEAGAPDGGWCGEAAIQMACLRYGAYIPQRVINKAGDPQHADLYAEELGKALDGVGFTGAHFRPREARESTVAGFIAWIRTHLAAGRPVLVGAKLNPTQHPEWVCDHFMLAVGAKANSLTFNTTWKRREELTHEQLAATAKGLGFENRYRRYFGLVVTGRKSTKVGERPVSMVFETVKDSPTVKCTLTIKGLEKGQQYALVNGAENEVFTADVETRVIAKTIPADKAAVFSCIPALELPKANSQEP